MLRYIFIFLMMNRDDHEASNYVTRTNSQTSKAASMKILKEEWSACFQDDYEEFDTYLDEVGRSWMDDDFESWIRIDTQDGSITEGKELT
jgi:hypothetical protein